MEQLLRLNRQFYGRFALPFSASRLQPQPGFARLFSFLPVPCHSVLDVGCGNGRFAHFLQSHQSVERYVGVDFSSELLEITRSRVSGSFYERDLSQPDCLQGLGVFEVAVCLAVLQHIPGRHRRVQLLRQIKEQLTENGRLVLSNWQFLAHPRQKRKVVDWSAIGLTAAQVEPGDYLLSWERGGSGLRYVCLLDEGETAELAADAGFSVLSHFFSDGKEGTLNLYTVLSVDTPPANVTI